MKFHTVKSNARRDARKQFGVAAKEGVDYELVAGAGGHAVRAIIKVRPAKTGTVRKVMGLSPAGIKAKTKANRAAKLKAVAGKPVSVFKTPAAKARKFKTAKESAGAWLDQLLAMLSRPKGATALEVGEAFGWLEHTSRARISVGPRARGARAERTREERPDKHGKLKMVSVYRLATELPLGQKRDELGVRYVKPDRARKVKAAA